jgi:hypothetical protein
VPFPFTAKFEGRLRLTLFCAVRAMHLTATSNSRPGIHCEDATEKALRDSCKTVLETLGSDVREAKEGIARYRELSTPSRADLFDIYQIFQKIMAEVGELGYAGELYGEHNRELFAKVWNNFVKFTGWFGAEVRAGLPDTEKVCECGDN